MLLRRDMSQTQELVELLVGLGSLAVVPALPQAAEKRGEKVPVLLNFTVDDIEGRPVNLARYQGQVLLIVNVASYCGNTPQYASLQGLYEKYRERGFSVLGFPANEFGGQEPGTNAEIAEFCQKNYGVEFDMFSKIVVRGTGQHPLYKHLTSASTNPKFAGEVSWNFEKFLIGRDGQIAGRFLSPVEPLSAQLVGAIEAALAKK